MTAGHSPKNLSFISFHCKDVITMCTHKHYIQPNSYLGIKTRKKDPKRGFISPASPGQAKNASADEGKLKQCRL